jgi:hypothetical protein
MADVVHVKAPNLTQAAATVAQHIETAATPASAVAPHSAPASPVDVATSGAAGAIHTKMTALSTELAPKGPAIQQAGTAAAASLHAQDTSNASRISAVRPAPPRPRKPHIQAVDRTWKQDPAPPPPPPKPPVEGIPPAGLRPPVDGPLTEGPASKPSRAAKGGRSLYDQHGGEWRYFPGDRRHNPHWDYKPRPGPGSKWGNVGIGGLPPLKDVPDPSIISGLPPWLVNPAAPAPPGVVGPPQNPLLAPFPGATMPAPPPASAPPPGPSLIPHINMPHIDVPAPSPGEGELAGGGLLALLLLGAVALA